MGFEIEEGKMMVHANKWKKTDRHPDYMGEANINGEIMEVALWSKTSQKSLKTFFSGTIQSKKEREERFSKKEKEPEKKVEGDEDIPF